MAGWKSWPGYLTNDYLLNIKTQFYGGAHVFMSEWKAFISLILVLTTYLSWAISTLNKDLRKVLLHQIILHYRYYNEMHVVVHQSILESDFINFEIGVLYLVIGKGSFLPRSLIRGSCVILYFSYNFCPTSNIGMVIKKIDELKKTHRGYINTQFMKWHVSWTAYFWRYSSKPIFSRKFNVYLV